MRRLRAAAAATQVLFLLGACSTAAKDSSEAIVIGAIYPTGGPQAEGGLEEYRGVKLAAELANRERHPSDPAVELRLEPAYSAEGAVPAVERLDAAGVDIIVGSYGSTISLPVAEAASRAGALFWETGAVGELSMGAATGDRVFRFSPTGASLGRSAVSFMRDRLLPKLDAPRDVRYTVVHVDDPYGRAVGLGARDQILESGLTLAATIPYDAYDVDFVKLAEDVREARTDVLVVVAYLEDGVEMRRTFVEKGVPLVASIGTSSSYCHPAFGDALGRDAVGLFASDKPDGYILRTESLTEDAAGAAEWARDEYERRWNEPMGGAALSGFAAGWALFHHVLPAAETSNAAAVARAALETQLPLGSLPNGSGLDLQAPGTNDAGANLNAASVIWEWTRSGNREIVWPPAFATSPILPMPIA